MKKNCTNEFIVKCILVCETKIYNVYAIHFSVFYNNKITQSFTYSSMENYLYTCAQTSMQANRKKNYFTFFKRNFKFSDN